MAYDPTLSVMEAFQDLGARVRWRRWIARWCSKWARRALLASTRSFLAVAEGRQAMRAAIACLPIQSGAGQAESAAGLAERRVVGDRQRCGQSAGLHGPTIHRELQLWVEAGIPPAVALQAATYNAATLLRAEQRIGLIQKGYEATMLLVNGNPLKDIKLTENIQTLYFKGEGSTGPTCSSRTSRRNWKCTMPSS